MAERFDEWGFARTSPARDEMDWLPASTKMVQWLVAGPAMVLAAVAVPRYRWDEPLRHLREWVQRGASGFYAGHAAARVALRRSLRRMGPPLTAAELARRPDGTLVYVKGRVRAGRTLPGLLDGGAAVFRRVVFLTGNRRWVHEAGFDFSLIDPSGERVNLLVDGACLICRDSPLRWQDVDVSRRVLSLPLPEALRRSAGARTVTAAEVLVRDGDEIELVGAKHLIVDQTQAERLERETPMRLALRSPSAGRPLLMFSGEG